MTKIFILRNGKKVTVPNNIKAVDDTDLEKPKNYTEPIAIYSPDSCFCKLVLSQEKNKMRVLDVKNKCEIHKNISDNKLYITIKTHQRSLFSLTDDNEIIKEKIRTEKNRIKKL